MIDIEEILGKERNKIGKCIVCGKETYDYYFGVGKVCNNCFSKKRKELNEFIDKAYRDYFEKLNEGHKNFKGSCGGDGDLYIDWGDWSKWPYNNECWKCDCCDFIREL